MRRILFLLAVLPSLAAAQTAPADSVYEAAEVMPEIVGGPAALARAVVYPQDALREGTEGTVVLRLVVDAEGVPSEAEVLRAPSPSLGAAALAALDATRFTPGAIGGRPVAVRMALPVRFRLPEAPAPVAPLAILPSRRETDPVEEPPVLEGGLRGLAQRLEYPVAARRARIQGVVVVEFVVTEEGLVESPVVIQSAGPLLDAAALDAVRESRFRPGRQDGRAVRVRFSVPLTFRLR